MSTYWYYECQQHDPAIRSEDGLNHGNRDLAELLRVFKEGRLPRESHIGPVEIDVQVYGSSWPWRFLLAHPDCKIGIVSEYDDTFVNGVVFKRDGSILEPIPKEKR